MNPSTRTVKCPHCNGTGRTWSDASRALSNCINCLGTGQLDEAALHDRSGAEVATAFFQKFGPPLDRHVEPSRFGEGIRWKDAINRAVGIEHSGLPQLKSPAEWLADPSRTWPCHIGRMTAFIEAIQQQAFECGVAMAIAELEIKKHPAAEKRPPVVRQTKGWHCTTCNDSGYVFDPKCDPNLGPDPCPVCSPKPQYP